MSAADLGDMSRLLGDAGVMTYYPAPLTRAGVVRWIAWNQANYDRDGFGLWLLRDMSGRFVGDCGLTWQLVDGVRELEVGYHLLPEFRGLGLATEAAAACRDLARARGIQRLIAITHPENRASQRVAEKTGLTLERDTLDRSGSPVRVYGAAI
jgi:RimJ/RimL family protein N-acetyltransferase